MTSDRFLFPSLLFSFQESQSAGVKARHQAFGEYMVPDKTTGTYPTVQSFWMNSAARQSLIDDDLIKCGYCFLFMVLVSSSSYTVGRKTMAVLRALMCFERVVLFGMDRARFCEVILDPSSGESYLNHCYDDEAAFLFATELVVERAQVDVDVDFARHLMAQMIPHTTFLGRLAARVGTEVPLLKCFACNKPDARNTCNVCGMLFSCTNACKVAHVRTYPDDSRGHEPVCRAFCRLLRHKAESTTTTTTTAPLAAAAAAGSDDDDDDDDNNNNNKKKKNGGGNPLSPPPRAPQPPRRARSASVLASLGEGIAPAAAAPGTEPSESLPESSEYGDY